MWGLLLDVVVCCVFSFLLFADHRAFPCCCAVCLLRVVVCDCVLLCVAVCCRLMMFAVVCCVLFVGWRRLFGVCCVLLIVCCSWLLCGV